MSIYYFQRFSSNNGSNYTSYVLLKNTNESIELNSFNFKSRIANFLADCPEIQAKIDNNEYKYRDLKKIAAEYEICSANSKDKSDKSLLAIDQFRVSLEQSLQDLNKADIRELLNDIQKRFVNKEAIPDFLWSGLIALVEADTELKKKAESLKTIIGN